MAGVRETEPEPEPEPAPARDQDGRAPADFRVRCTLKRAVAEVMGLCGRFVRELGAALPDDVRELALRDAQWRSVTILLKCLNSGFRLPSADVAAVNLLQTFESAVEENVSINGQAWQEAADHCLMDSDIKVLEDEFDELIVDVATKRRQYPRRILESVIKTLKAQHETLKQYRPVVHPLDLKCDPDPASHVENLKCRGDAIAKEISDAMKALPVLIEQGEGFSQVLKMQPVIQLQRINQEVFSSCYRRADTKPSKSITQVETTPTETAARSTSNIVLKRKHAPDCSQRRRYPLRPKRINLDT